MYIYIYGVLLKPLRMSVMSNLPQSSGQPSVFCKASSLSPSLYLVTFPLKKKKTYCFYCFTVYPHFPSHSSWPSREPSQASFPRETTRQRHAPECEGE